MLECAFNSNEKITSFRRTRNLQDSYLESLTNSICFLRKKKEKQWTQLDIHCIKILFEYASAQEILNVEHVNTIGGLKWMHVT